MNVPFDSGLIARPTALAALASLLIAAACSAPPGLDGDDEGLPEFGGAVQTPPAGAGGAPGAIGTPSANAPVNTAPAPTPVTPNEQTANGGIGLAPAPSADQSGNQNQGAGGSAMVAPDPSAGTGGSSFETPAAGGATSLPPNDANQQPPPNDGAQQQPNDGNQQPPPNDGNQQPPPPQQPAAPPPSGDCAGAFFCDGFENVAPGASPTSAVWQIVDDFGVTDASESVTVTAANARSGTQSLRVTGSNQRDGVRATLPQSSYFVRAFFQLDAAPRGTVFIGTGTSENNESRFRIQGESYATINSVGSPDNDAVRPSDANNGNGCADCLTLPVNEWFCAELAVDNAASTATLFINDVEVAVAGPDAFTPQPAQPLLFLGSWGLQGGVTGVFIDDVAVGPERFGCN